MFTYLYVCTVVCFAVKYYFSNILFYFWLSLRVYFDISNKLLV